MKTVFLGTRNPHCVLGVPSFANAEQILSAYRKRVEVLLLYQFDKVTHPVEWQIVNDMRCELTEAYVQVRSSDYNGNRHATATTTLLDEDMPATCGNPDNTPVTAEKRGRGADGTGRPYVAKSKSLVLSSTHGGFQANQHKEEV
jgi:hypothetical protein